MNNNSIFSTATAKRSEGLPASTLHGSSSVTIAFQICWKTWYPLTTLSSINSDSTPDYNDYMWVCHKLCRCNSPKLILPTAGLCILANFSLCQQFPLYSIRLCWFFIKWLNIKQLCKY